MVDSNEKVYLCTQNQFMTMKQTRTAREMLARLTRVCKPLLTCQMWKEMDSLTL